jgi:hypothetical protein
MNTNQLRDILAKHKRVAIIGGPKAGKTTLANFVTDRTVLHSDDGKHLGWEAQPEFIKQKLANQDSFVAEGVHVSRALRKGLKVDAIIHLENPHQELSSGQAAMHKGQQKIIREALQKHAGIKVYK